MEVGGDGEARGIDGANAQLDELGALELGAGVIVEGGRQRQPRQVGGGRRAERGEAGEVVGADGEVGPGRDAQLLAGSRVERAAVDAAGEAGDLAALGGRYQRRRWPVVDELADELGLGRGEASAGRGGVRSISGPRGSSRRNIHSSTPMLAATHATPTGKVKSR